MKTQLGRRIERALVEAEIWANRRLTPSYLTYPAVQDYSQACARGEVPPGVKVYISLPEDAL
jgi:hypothetical protein